MKRLTIKKTNSDTYFTHRDNMAVDFNENLNMCIGGEVIDKLGQLEDIEEELGIGLITLFEALKQGIWYKKNGTVYYSKATLISCVKNDKKESFWNFTTNENQKEVEITGFALLDQFEGNLWYFKDYGKTWALTKEELENE